VDDGAKFDLPLIASLIFILAGYFIYSILQHFFVFTSACCLGEQLFAATNTHALTQMHLPANTHTHTHWHTRPQTRAHKTKGPKNTREQ